MSFLCRNLLRIPRFRIDHTEIIWKLIPRKYSSSLVPIKMAAEIFKSSSSDPEAPPLMVMHGFLDSSDTLRKICQGLEYKTKRAIYNLDARNHGESPHIAAHSSGHMAEDIAFLMEEEKIERVSVMGHSMGGRTMMFFALNFPKLVEKAIIVDISPISVPRNLKTMQDIFITMKDIDISPKLSMEQALKVAEKELNKAVNDKESVKFILRNLKKTRTGEFVWRPNIEGLSSSVKHFRVTQYFANMEPFTGPVLFIAGQQSVFFNPHDWPKIKKIFPNAEVKWIDAGHWVHLDKPEEFTEMVSDFLNTTSAS